MTGVIFSLLISSNFVWSDVGFQKLPDNTTLEQLNELDILISKSGSVMGYYGCTYFEIDATNLRFVSAVRLRIAPTLVD